MPLTDPFSHSLIATSVTKRFPGVTAVNNINLTVEEGEFYGFLGPNGAGKSTTIRMLCGLLQPTEGKIQVAGYNMAEQPLEVKQRIGVLFDEPNLYERLTAEEFLRFSGRMFGLTSDEAYQRTGELLDLMELGEAKDRLIIDYSMGMKKKTALAGALIHGPKVLFLDEPFNGIDPISGRAIRRVLRHLTERGTTVFFTSHVMEVVERLCTRVAIIDKGEIVGEGTIEELRTQTATADDSSLEDIFISLVDVDQDNDMLSWL